MTKKEFEMTLEDFEKEVQETSGIKILIGDMARAMIQTNPGFTEHCVRKIVEKWSQSDYATPEEGIRNLNAACWGVMLALQIVEEYREESNPTMVEQVQKS